MEQINRKYCTLLVHVIRIYHDLRSTKHFKKTLKIVTIYTPETSISRQM